MSSDPGLQTISEKHSPVGDLVRHFRGHGNPYPVASIQARCWRAAPLPQLSMDSRHGPDYHLQLVGRRNDTECWHPTPARTIPPRSISCRYS